MPWIKGADLDSAQRTTVLAAFGYRWTRDNDKRVSWWKHSRGACPTCDMTNYTPNLKTSEGHNHPTIPLISDTEWLATYQFHFNKDRRTLSANEHCEPVYLSLN